MKGVYSVERKGGTAVYITYTSGGKSTRELYRTVPHGDGFGKRLAAAERDAGKELISIKAALNEGRFHLVEQRKARRTPTFAEYAREHYIPSMQSGTNSARERMKDAPLRVEIRRCTSGTLGRYFGAVALDQITRTRIEQFIAQRRSEGAVRGATINRDLARLRNLLNDAADRDELRLELPRISWTKLRQREEPTSYRAMRDEEEPKVFAQLTDRIERAYVETLLHTGIRPEAALRLRLGDHVDLEGGRIWVGPELDKIGRGYVVYINSHLLPVLCGLVAWRPERFRQPGSELFCHRNGKPRKTVRVAWRVACDAAEVEWRGARGLKLRSLRPTFKTRILTAGGAEVDAERLLGHSVRAVKDRYYDPDEAHLRKVVELTIRDRDNVVPLRPAAEIFSRFSRATNAAVGTKV
ncbi:MAG TPA: tyrosine-type recombinase/integrase [Myxococcota bacterium]|nr:tyrosine-type recombinase/integrase [Myxococcota bacterium]